MQGFCHLLKPDFLRIHSVDHNPVRQGTAMQVNVHEGQKTVEPQFFIAIEDDSDISNQAAPSGKDHSALKPQDVPRLDRFGKKTSPWIFTQTMRRRRHAVTISF